MELKKGVICGYLTALPDDRRRVVEWCLGQDIGFTVTEYSYTTEVLIRFESYEDAMMCYLAVK